MKYHSLKMEEINRILEELWKKTYQGTDVDTILIRSENENAKGNRSYDYRVSPTQALESTILLMKSGMYGEARRRDGYARKMQCRPEGTSKYPHPTSTRRLFRHQLWGKISDSRQNTMQVMQMV